MREEDLIIKEEEDLTIKEEEDLIIKEEEDLIIKEEESLIIIIKEENQIKVIGIKVINSMEEEINSTSTTRIKTDIDIKLNFI